MTPNWRMRPVWLRFAISESVGIQVLLSEENQPQQAGAKREEARIEKSERTNFCFELESNKQDPRQESQDRSKKKAQHPHREE